MSNRSSSTQTGLASTLAAEMRTVFRKLKLRLREHGGHGDLTPSQIYLSSWIGEGRSATFSSLARTEGISPQSMSAVVTPLLESGLVKGAVTDPGDEQANSDVSGAQMPEIA